MDKLKQVIDRYSKNNSSLHVKKKLVSVSTRIDPKTKIQLEIISSLFEKKQTPLLAEIIETAINEIFDQIDLSEELKMEFKKKMKEAGLDDYDEIMDYSI